MCGLPRMGGSSAQGGSPANQSVGESSGRESTAVVFGGGSDADRARRRSASVAGDRNQRGHHSPRASRTRRVARRLSRGTRPARRRRAAARRKKNPAIEPCLTRLAGSHGGGGPAG